MDDRLRIFLWIVGGGAFGAVLGGAFGGLTGALFAQSGGAAGTGFGRRVADAFAQTSLHPPSPLRRATLTGAADGFLFLGLLGIVAGALLGASGRAADEVLMPALAGSVILVGGAIFFGTLALAMSHSARTVGSVVAGGLFGAFIAALTVGADRLLLGVAPGLLLGLLYSLGARRYASTFQPPRIGKTIPHNRTDSETDITETPHAHSDEDSFRKPDGEWPA
jgi:hypothetical protein